jgi:arginine/lysine/ornithine decarboxylase
VVLMLTPSVGAEGLERLTQALCEIPRREKILDAPPPMTLAQRVMTVREATLRPHESLPAEDCLGRVLGSPSVGCPPAVPVLACGERIDEHSLCAFRYYGITTCTVVKE